MPYTKSAIPITKAASAIPNRGDAIIMIDKAMANAPAATLNALEPVLAVCLLLLLLLSSLFPPLRPAIMLEMPLNSKAMAARIQPKLQKLEDMPEQCLKGLSPIFQGRCERI